MRCAGSSALKTEDSARGNPSRPENQNQQLEENEMMKVNNIDLHVQIEGTGIPMIWGHGLMASMAADDLVGWIKWNQLTDVIRLVRYDARGHGQSGASDALADYHWSALARDMLALAEQVGFDRFVVSGQSMGCGTSLYAALAAPERIRGLVLMNPPTAWETRAAQAALYGQMADLIDARGPDFLLTMMQQQPATGPIWQTEPYLNMMEDLRAYFKSLDPKVLTSVLRGAQLANLPPAVELEAIHAPALILAWTEDVGHPISSAEEVARRLPNSRLLIAQNAAEAATWTEEIRKFVTTLP
jgi:pimeloyl-ACP methyl ester carboxylesterase